MTIDLQAVRSFLAMHARVLDRHRLQRLLGGKGDSGDGGAGVVAALDAYRNPDGGYGWGLEPDLRSAESQPAAALHAFEVMAEAGSAGTRPVELCDWLHAISLPDGGLPFALPIAEPAGCAPWWTQADPTGSSLQITAAVAANAHRVGHDDQSVADHPWLADATRFCLEAVRAMDASPHAYELSFALGLVDVVADHDPGATGLLERLARHIPPAGAVPVAGGAENEMLRPLDLAPDPGRPVRDLFRPGVIAADLDRLAGEQQPDGGWAIDWATSSPAAALEWRGYVTVRAVTILRRHGKA